MIAAASLSVQPFLSPHPSMPHSPAQLGAAPSVGHLASVMMRVGCCAWQLSWQLQQCGAALGLPSSALRCRQRLRRRALPRPPAPLQSYTSSPVDPNARLFYNPAYNDDTLTRMSDSKSIIRCGGELGGWGLGQSRS